MLGSASGMAAHEPGGIGRGGIRVNSVCTALMHALAVDCECMTVAARPAVLMGSMRGVEQLPPVVHPDDWTRAALCACLLVADV